MAHHVFQCAQCGNWREGAAYVGTDVPRDRYGRLLDRDYSGPEYCTEACRAIAEAVNDEYDEMAHPYYGRQS